MASKLLQGIGICAVIALALGSIAALLVVDRRLHITVAEEQDAARRGPDPLALLTADVGTVHEELRVLGDGVGTQMQALHDALEGSAAEREAKLSREVVRLREEVATLRAHVERTEEMSEQSRAGMAAALGALGEGLQRVAAAVSEGATRPVALAPIEIPTAIAVAPVETFVVAPAGQQETAAVAAAPEPTAADVPKKSFLSFQLPSRSFAFDQRQRFAIVPSLSRIGFDAKSTLHDFSGVTTVVEGEITANLAHPAEACAGSITARADSLDTGLEARDESMREALEPKLFPDLRFEWTSFEPTRVDEAAQKVAGVAQGKLTIHGVAREIAMPVTVVVDASKRLSIDGQVKIRMSDYAVRPPSKLGVISVEDEAVIWIALRARTLGPAPVTPR